MEPFEWSAEQQEDMRGLLKMILDYLKEKQPTLFQEGEVLVTPKFASIAVPIGVPKPPQEDSSDHAMRQQENRNTRVRKLKKPILDFLMEQNLGSPLYAHFDNTAEHLIMRAGLKPNDILGAERSVNRAIQRLKEKYETEKVQETHV